MNVAPDFVVAKAVASHSLVSAPIKDCVSEPQWISTWPVTFNSEIWPMNGKVEESLLRFFDYASREFPEADFD